MKKLILILTLLFTTTVFPEEMPKYMKDGIITVTLKDGKVYTFSTNEYMVVKRGAKKEASPVTIIEQKEEKTVIAVQPRKKHILSAMAGFSRHDLDSKVSGTGVYTENDHDFDFGIQYQYEVSQDIYLNVLGTVNETGLIGVGFGF